MTDIKIRISVDDNFDEAKASDNSECPQHKVFENRVIASSPRVWFKSVKYIWLSRFPLEPCRKFVGLSSHLIDENVSNQMSSRSISGHELIAMWAAIEGGSCSLPSRAGRCHLGMAACGPLTRVELWARDHRRAGTAPVYWFPHNMQAYSPIN